MVRVKSFEGKEGENLMLWIREVEMAMSSVLLQTEQQRVVLRSLSSVGERMSGLSRASSVDGTFPTWDELKEKLSVVFLPPNHVFRVRSRILVCRQDKKNLLNFVQGLRTLIAGMFADPLPEAVTTTVFMDGLRTSVARTEVFRSRPGSFEEAVAVALNAEYNFKSAHASWIAPSASTPEGPEPMDLSSTEEQVAALHAEEEDETQSVGDVVFIGRGVQRTAPRDCSEQLYTLFNGVTGEVDGNINLDTLPSCNALL
ncbi:Gag Polyprotein, partial [Phytophthora megakarya]